MQWRRREEVDAEVPGESDQPDDREHEAHRLVDDGGDDPSVGAVRRPFERGAENDFGHGLVAFAPSGQPDAHGIGRARDDRVPKELHDIAVGDEILERARSNGLGESPVQRHLLAPRSPGGRLDRVRQVRGQVADPIEDGRIGVVPDEGMTQSSQCGGRLDPGVRIDTFR